jgi:hypothetical protein
VKKLILIFLSFAAYTAVAQPGDPGGDPDVPISGLEILIAAGSLLGFKKVREAIKRKDR